MVRLVDFDLLAMEGHRHTGVRQCDSDSVTAFWEQAKRHKTNPHTYFSGCVPVCCTPTPDNQQEVAAAVSQPPTKRPRKDPPPVVHAGDGSNGGASCDIPIPPPFRIDRYVDVPVPRAVLCGVVVDAKGIVVLMPPDPNKELGFLVGDRLVAVQDDDADVVGALRQVIVKSDDDDMSTVDCRFCRSCMTNITRIATLKGDPIMPRVLYDAVESFGGPIVVFNKSLWSSVRVHLNLGYTTSSSFVMKRVYTQYFGTRLKKR